MKKDILEKYQIKTNEVNIVEIDKILTIANDLMRKEPLDALELSHIAYTFSINEKYNEGLVQSLLNIAKLQYQKGEYQNSLYNATKGLDKARNIGNNRFISSFLNLLGNINLDLKIYEKALDYYQEALKISRKIDDKRLQAGLLNNIGEIYRELKDFDRAIDYYNSSLEVSREYKALVLLNISDVYCDLADYDISEKFALNSLNIALEEDDKIIEGHCYYLLGIIYLKTNRLELGREYFDKSLSISKQLGNFALEVDTLIALSDLLILLKQHECAIEFLKKAMELSEKSKIKPLISKTCFRLASIYEELKEYKKSIEYYKKHFITEKEIDKQEIEQKLRNISINIQVEKERDEHEKIKLISEIGKEIVSSLDLKKILECVYENINKIVEANVFGIGLFDEKTNNIEYKLYIEDGKIAPNFSISIDREDSWAVWTFKNKKEILVNDVEQEYPYYIKGKKNTYGALMNSVMFFPLIVEEEVIGVVTLQSKRKNAFDENLFTLVKALVYYVSTAVNNARKSEELAKEIEERKKAQIQLENLNERLLRLSELDGLTGIPNRRSFDETLENEWNRAIRGGYPLSLMIIDVDHFKQYNDYYGHLQGDEVIKNIANTLCSTIKRKTDFVARYGGDEFIAILPDTDEKGAKIVADEIIKAVEDLKIYHDKSKTSNFITVTIGISTEISVKNKMKEKLIEKADKALYIAKAKGRNIYEVVV